MSVNKVTLLGNLGADPEVKYTTNNNPVLNFRMATTDRWTDRTSGQKQERTEWHRIQHWGKTVGALEKMLRKGSRVYVEGSIRTREWTDKEGQKRYTTEINAREIKILDPKPREEEAYDEQF